jgi:DNA replication protein DnaC
MSSPTKSLNPASDLSAQLKQIGLNTIPDHLDDFLARAAQAHWSARTLLEQVAREETQERSRRSLERRLRRSRIKKFKVMADFEWSWPKKVEREVIEQALTLDFLREARNFVLIGPNGLGKTMIAKNICHLAVLAGYSVLFRSAAAIVEDLRHEMFEGRRRKLRGYGKVDVLCIDECAYLSFDEKAADILYEVINRRYESKSVILTTNRSFKEWNQVFPNATCIATMLDRLLHHADVTRLDGESYRIRESQLEAEARRKKP